MEFRIKEILKERGMTALALSQRIGATQAYISNVMTGAKTPSMEMLEQIASGLDVEVRDLFALKSDEVNGFVKIKGEIRELKSKADIEDVLGLLDSRPVRNVIDKEEMMFNLIASAQIEGITLSREKAEKMWEKAISKNCLPQ